MEELRRLIREAKFADEALLVEAMLADYPLQGPGREGLAQQVEAQAAALVEGVRARRSDHTLLDTFVQEYGLANDEGVALMCLAESLLRVPDADTMDALIKDKILPANWANHLGDSASILVNASTWGLMLTGKVIGMQSWPSHTAGDFVGHLLSRVGEPVIRTAMQRAMHILGREFVLGRTIEEALDRGGAEGVFSFDMLGEAARTADIALNYFQMYAHAVEVVGGARAGSNGGSGVSVKLSALHPRYEYAQHDRVMTQLLPRLLRLCEAAAGHDIALSIDAEEADRLELSLELFEQVARAPALAGWEGLGIVVQAYGKRALPCIDWVAELARRTHRRINVRLVKGAYWDSEIKHAQEMGLPDFSVFTVKANTDIGYLACASKLLGGVDVLYPQFATHNAHTVTAVMALAGDERNFEFQRLHGMGQLLYTLARDGYEAFPRLRVYAPVGGHEDLLPYLVRRLLENGANSSFVNRFLDESTPALEVVRDPAAQVRRSETHRHERLRQPGDLYGAGRPNSKGSDLADAIAVARLSDSISPYLQRGRADKPPQRLRKMLSVQNPADHSDLLESVVIPNAAAIDKTVLTAAQAQGAWDRAGGTARAGVLRAAADLLAANRPELMALLIREAGKTIPDAVSEVREAEDFCRYYADLAERQFEAPTRLPGPTGERNELSLHGRGVFVCISPWNFPLAIFIGQVAGALLAGNAVVAKPAEQTPLIARRAVELLVEAGVPPEVVQVIPGAAGVGARLVSSHVIAGVAFTGSTETARTINRALAKRDGPIVPLIAETGGQNAMIVDSTALLDQVADDVVSSAFSSAGQRCSALRILLLQEEIADRALELILGAMNELRLGDPARLSTDIGPVIDANALASLQAHIKACRRTGYPIHVAAGEVPDHGTFLAPHLIELDDVSALTAEHFGPILHVVRFAAFEFPTQLAKIRDLEYGLTMGVHSRIEQRVAEVFAASIAGNTYVNRNMIGAVVGVQPFGGFGLSGTGPKAGGPGYLQRFATERTLTVNTMAQGGNIDLLREDS